MEVRRGRVRLDMIAIEQAEGRALDPALLAFQAAAVIRSLSPEWLVISAEKVGVSLSGGTPGSITIGALADYFDAIGRGSTPRTIASTSGDALAAAVTVDRAWIAIPFAEAVKRAAFASGFASPLNDSPCAAAVANASPVTRQAEPSPPPSGSEHGYQKMLQDRQRREGERSAAEQLYAMRMAVEHAERKAALLWAEREAFVADIQSFQEEAELLRRKANEARRAMLVAEERMREERSARLLAEEKIEKSEKRAQAAESALNALPSKFPELERQLAEVLALFGKKQAQRSALSNKVLLLTVAGLLELLLDRKRPPYNRGAAAAAIALRGWHGAGVRQVNEVFAEARKEAEKARKEAVTKAMDMQDSNAAPPD